MLMKRLNLIILCLFIGIGAAIAQTMKVKGIVTDEAGEPIVGCLLYTSKIFGPANCPSLVICPINIVEIVFSFE